MKKFIFSFIFLFVSLFCYSQAIICDKTENDLRYIKTEKIVTKDNINNSTWNIGLNGYRKNNDSILYELTININKSKYVLYPYNLMMLIKTFDNKIIELDNDYIYCGSIIFGNKYNELIINNVFAFYQDNYVSTVAFNISANEIKLFDKGIKKIRIQTLNDYEEIIYEIDMCGKRLYQALNNINNRFNIDNSIYSNF